MDGESSTGVGNFIRSIIGSKEDFQEKGQEGKATGTGAVISAYSPEEFAGEPFEAEKLSFEKKLFVKNFKKINLLIL